MTKENNNTHPADIAAGLISTLTMGSLSHIKEDDDLRAVYHWMKFGKATEGFKKGREAYDGLVIVAENLSEANAIKAFLHRRQKASDKKLAQTI